MNDFISSLTSQAAAACGRIIFAVIVLLIGKILIRMLLKLLNKNKLLDKTAGAVKTFSLSFIKIGLYVLLIVCIVGILGVPMASIAALVASAGVAVGLGFQGALSNLAGGIMLVIFKPFQLGDFIEAAGVSGTAAEINLFYTVVTTPDNKRVTIPNGNLMNSNITDCSANEFRRVELTFTCARSENPSRVQEIMKQTMAADTRILSRPEPPFASISGSTNDAHEFTVRAWCRTDQYLDVLFGLNQCITEALADADIQAPVLHVSAKQTP